MYISGMSFATVVPSPCRVDGFRTPAVHGEIGVSTSNHELVCKHASSAQSAQFSEKHSLALDENPPGVKLTIETMPERSSYRLSDEIPFKLTFTSQKAQVYTIDTAAGGNAAASTTDFIIEGPV
jgi:hypothetical protein